MRLIDADQLKKDNPMCEYCGYRQSDIDSAPTVEAVTKDAVQFMGQLLEEKRKTVKGKNAREGFDLAVEFIEKYLGGFMK